MAIIARRTNDALIYALIATHNQGRVNSVTSQFHSDITAKSVSADYRNPVATSAAITSANATDLPTLLTLCAEIAIVHALHVGDGLVSGSAQGGAHKVADTTDVLANAAPTDLATAQTFLNDAKAKVNAHYASTTYHYNADGTNTIAAADASNLGTAQTLANAYKTAFNAHIASAPTGAMIKLVGP